MTAINRQIEHIVFSQTVLLAVAICSYPLQAEANPSRPLETATTAALLLPLQTQTINGQENVLSADRLERRFIIAQQAPSNPQEPVDPGVPYDPQLPTDSQTPTAPVVLPDQSAPSATPPSENPESDAKKKKTRRINYAGIGGNIGLNNDGGTALGSGGFTVLNRNSLTNNLSIHSTSVFGDQNLSSIALTGGAPIKNKKTGKTIIFPFVGAGMAIQTKDFTIDPMITAGVDVPLTQYLTGTMRVNASFDDGTDVGVVMGVGVDLFGLIFRK